MRPTILDSEKGVNVILYLATKLPERRNAYKILKAIYRANKNHLAQYGRQIFNETYQALEWGTVPAFAYDVVTYVQRGKLQPRMPSDVKKKLKVSALHTVTPLVKPNLRALSDSDIECLDEAVEFYRPMTFDEVADNAHEDAAYKDTPQDTFIPLEKIILTLPDGQRLLEQLKAA